MECRGYIHTCRKCKKRHHDWDKTNPCECGEDRKCHNEAVQGWVWCSVHGGPAPKRGYYGRGRGLVSGTDSQFPLIRLAAKYDELRKNGVIWSNRAVLEVIQIRILQLAERIDLNEAPERMKKLKRLWDEYRLLDRQGNAVEARVKAIEIDNEFEAAYHDYAAWEQMFDALDLHGKTTEREVKMMKDMKAMMTAEQGYELVAQVMSIILEVEDDPKKLKRYQHEFTRLVGDESDQRAGRGGTKVLDSGSGGLD